MVKSVLKGMSCGVFESFSLPLEETTIHLLFTFPGEMLGLF